MGDHTIEIKTIDTFDAKRMIGKPDEQNLRNLFDHIKSWG